MMNRDGFGHSQEVVWSASGHMGLSTARSRVELQAGTSGRMGIRLERSCLLPLLSLVEKTNFKRVTAPPLDYGLLFPLILLLFLH